VDYVIAGIDPESPNVARMAAVSVDFNELLDAYVLDNAGAQPVDGDPCGGDAVSSISGPVNCIPIPVPAIVASTGGEAPTLTLGIGEVSGIPLLDDCLIAETRATNCPRNLYAARVLMYQRASCATGTGAGLDLRAFLYLPPPPAGTLAVLANWRVFSVEDQNLNQALDAGEDGSNGGEVDGLLDPLLIGGTAATEVTVSLPTMPGATDCLYFALAIGLDNNRLFVDQPTNTIVGEMVFSPMVSVNPTPIALNVPPPSDTVLSITARKSGGTVTVAWTSGNELATAGFNVIGVGKNGSERRLNASLIPAKEGTTGLGADYGVTFETARLKGSSAVIVELVKFDGSTQRFGPVLVSGRAACDGRCPGPSD
jgi:hypothetical protein